MPSIDRSVQIENWLGNLPLLHTWDQGKCWNTGGFIREHLEPLHRFLGKHLPKNASYLETGAGNSTLLFLLSEPGQVITIAPDPVLFDKIGAYCREQGIDAGPLRAIVDQSEFVLPDLVAEAKKSGAAYDFILIDGCHNWPMVFVDFFYTNFLLKRGGYLMIDDVQLHSVKELARLLAQQPEFEMVLDLGKSRVYRKLTDARELGDWNSQPYITLMTERYAASGTAFALDPPITPPTDLPEKVARSTTWKVASPFYRLERFLHKRFRKRPAK